jgi:hypothetical protein
LLGKNLETNNETTLTARQQILNDQQLNYNNEEQCFLSGPCQGVINETSLEFTSFSETISVVRGGYLHSTSLGHLTHTCLLSLLSLKRLVKTVTD